MGKRLLRRMLPLTIFLLVGFVGAFAAYAATKPTKKATPICKTGQKTTKAHPCVKQTTKAKVTTTAKKATTTPKQAMTTTTAKATTPAAGGPELDENGCVMGQGIPQGGGDADADNYGGADDYDGCL